ncbi:MAG: DUF192 domain-containing protein, partial [Persicimonas sp.]
GLCAVLALAWTGCERSDAAKTVRQDPSSAQKAGSSAPEGLEEACSNPEECDSYLWCVDGKCELPPAEVGQADASTPRVSVADPDGEEVAKFYVELATTEAEKRKGLMYRRRLPDDWGMLFVYEDEAERGFWMQNTFVALDMIFADAGGRIVHIVEEAEPLTRVQRRSRKPARYVLEVNAGLSEKLGLEPGLILQMANVDPEHQPDD